ncbi:MAG TPA: DUF2889 domain-containing protein [Trebonia sp.]|nr:DUF2889 domain-containing protein [Trebonia sp.]
MSAPGQHPHTGLRAPARSSPARAPGSVRRTTVTDMLRPDGVTGGMVVRATGRDIRTSSSGEAVELSRAGLEVDIDYLSGRTVRAIASEPAEPALGQLVGASAASGFRRLARDAVPGQAARRTVLYQLLDDVPVAALIGGYAAGAMRRPGTLPAAGMGSRAGICAGFQDGGTMMDLVARHGSVPTVVGPVAPEVGGADPDGWQRITPLPPGGMRRRRLLDVTPDGAQLRVFTWFRDTFQFPGGDQTIVHEYEVDARVVPGSWTVAEATATPRVLPWSECPQAAASAGRLAGQSLPGLRERVRTDFVGISTCTHLNDQLRSLADVIALAEACLPAA